MDLNFDDLIPKTGSGEKQPRGIRNNNPLNIEAGAFTKSKPGFQGSDGRFAKFGDMQQGYAAAEDLLRVYGEKHGINTVSGVINRWAPEGDGNNVSVYAGSVAKDLGVSPNDPIDLLNPDVRSAMSVAMAKVENGRAVPRPTDVSAQAKPKADLSFDDLIPAAPAAQTEKPPAFADRFEGDKSNAGLKYGNATSGPERVAIDFANLRSGSFQGSSPDPSRYQMVSDRLLEGDDGLAYFLDRDGQQVQADSAQHVILKDPTDGKMKVYAKSADTTEGGLASAARLLAPGLAAGAPTRLPQGVQAVTSAAKEAAPALSEGQQVAQAAQRVGVELPRAVTSDTTAVQYAGKIASNVPVGGTPLRKAAQSAIGQMEDATQGAREAFGTGSIASAGAGIREGISDALKSGPIKQRVTELYNKVDDLVDPVTVSPMPNTRQLANTLVSRRTNAALPGSKNVAQLEEALSRPGMNYEGVKDLRSFFGEMLDGAKEIPEGLSMGEVKQIYGSLSKDMRLIIARAGGQEGLQAYDKAEKAAARWSKVREDLSRVLNIRNEEGIFAKIQAMAGSKSTADINMLGRVRGAIGPDKWDEVASAVIEKLGRAPDGTFSPDRFIGPSGLGGLSDEGKRMLFRSTGKMGHADAIDDIATISQRWKSLNQYANPSGTGQTVMGGAMGAGMFADPITTLSTIAGARVFSHILAKPATARSTAAWSRSYERAAKVQSMAAVEGFRQASKLLAANIGREVGRPDLVPQLTQKLQGAVPVAADEQQN
jgi:hypothetical protein